MVKTLSSQKVAKIKGYNDSGLSIWAISNKIDRSPTAAHDVFKLKDNYNKNRKKKKNQKLTTRQKSAILSSKIQLHQKLSLI